jgi:Integrase core domain
VITKAVMRATARPVCLAFVEAMGVYGVPEEVLTDGKVFTGRFHKPGVPVEVLFDKICRENGITHRLTKIHSPTTTGKIERLHQTLQRELLDVHGPFEGIEVLQAALDGWREEHNTDRPHQSLGMAFPASRFTPASSPLELRIPAQLTVSSPQPKAPRPADGPPPAQRLPAQVAPASAAVTGQDWKHHPGRAHLPAPHDRAGPSYRRHDEPDSRGRASRFRQFIGHAAGTRRPRRILIMSPSAAITALTCDF